MTSFPEIAGFAAGVVSLISYIFYYRSIFRRQTIPNRVTWFLLTIVNILICTSYYALGARATLWIPLSYLVGCFGIFILSLKYGEKKWTRFDLICLSGAAISLLVWVLSANALLSLLLNILIDFFGILPTIRKVYLYPRTEAFFPWLLVCIASVLNMFAITEWRFAIWIYPAYLLIFNAIIAGCIKFRRSM